jgi:hypothetical protein
MGLFAAIGGAIAGVAGVVKGAKKIWSKIKKPMPKVKVSAATAAGLGVGGLAMGQSLVPVSSSGGLPSVPLGPSAAGTTAAISSTSPGGLPVPFWKGPGGKLQMPWSDPRVPEYLKQFALDDAYLRTYYRAPKGYIVLRDASGRPFAVNKAIARQFGLWRPKRKPPISVSDWSAFKKAQRVEKKLRKVAGPALRKYSRRSSRTTTTRRK